MPERIQAQEASRERWSMPESISGNLKIWNQWVPPVKQPSYTQINDRVQVTRSYTVDQVKELFLAETFGRSSSQSKNEPYTLPWFLEIESLRYGRHGSWLPKLMEFSKHQGERLLGIGPGLGTDWVQYARQGADVVVCCSDSDQRHMIQKHFELRSAKASITQAVQNILPLESNSIDVVCLTSLLLPDSDPGPILQEVYRVLKPGGKILAIAKSYYNAHYWCYRWLPISFKRHDQGSLVEPLQYKKKQLKRMFDRFGDHHYYKRHLRRSDLPHIYRLLPLPLLEKIMGRFLVVKCFKPVSAAIQTSQAA